MSTSSPQPRREFLRQSTTTAAAIGTAAGLGALSVPAASQASKKPIPESARPAVFSTKARKARKIAVGPNDELFIAADKGIQVFDACGMKLREIPLPRPARCLAVSEQGTVYAGLIDQVRVFDAQGGETAAWSGFSPKSILAGIVLSENGLFIADAGEKVIWRVNPQGKIVGRIEGKHGFTGPAEFFSLRAGVDGSLHVANSARHQIESYGKNGAFVTAWGKRSRTLDGFSGCCNPVSFALLADGRTITAERGRPRVKIYDHKGRFQKLLAAPEQFRENMQASEKDNAPGCISGGLDLAIDSTGAAIVLDRVTGNVHRFAV